MTRPTSIIMANLSPFLTRYLYENAGIEEIHDDIERWSTDPNPQRQPMDFYFPSTELHEFLGLTKAEYQIFVENEWKFVRYLDHLKNDAQV